MKNLVMYHDHCTDGFGAAFAAWLVFGNDGADYLPVSYGKVKTVNDMANLSPKPIESYETVYVLDFSFSKEVTEWLFKAANQMVWLDHHKTAFEMWTGQYEKDDHYAEHSCCHRIILDDNKSGALLAWEHFHGDAYIIPPMMFQHIDDRDRWQFKLAGTKEFHAYMASIKPWSFSQWDDVLGVMERKIDDDGIYDEGGAILRAHQQDVKTIFDVGVRDCTILIIVPDNGAEPSQMPTNADGYKRYFAGKAANCPPNFASDVGHELANASGTYGLCWYVGRDGKVKCSLRSNGDYDVSAIAKAFGGGGHRNAAGFETSIENILEWIK